MAKKYLTAIELQDKKTDLEIKIANLLFRYNQICANNGFQVEEMKMAAHNTDHERTFEIDIHII